MRTARAVQKVMVKIEEPYCQRYSCAMNPAEAGILT